MSLHSLYTVSVNYSSKVESELDNLGYFDYWVHGPIEQLGWPWACIILYIPINFIDRSIREYHDPIFYVFSCSVVAVFIAVTS